MSSCAAARTAPSGTWSGSGGYRRMRSSVRATWPSSNVAIWGSISITETFAPSRIQTDPSYSRALERYHELQTAAVTRLALARRARKTDK